MGMKVGEFSTEYRSNFSGGLNNLLGSRQIKDSESPAMTNCDFKGKSGIGNRQGYTQVDTAGTRTSGTWGITRYSNSSVKQLVKFVSNGSNIALSYSTGAGSTWTDVTTTTVTNNLNVDAFQMGGKLYWPNNGTDTMLTWDGSSIATATEGATLLYPAYFDKRGWGVDPTAKDTLKFSVQYGDATKPLSFTNTGTSSDKGTVTILPGSGAEIRGIRSFKNALYVFLFPYGIYRVKTSSTINVFTVELVTNAVGCVSFRSIDQVGEDLFFAADDGIYSLGDVGTYTEVRSTNKSARIQTIYDSLSGASKAKLTGRYYNFKYHLFYSLFGSTNDSCLPYDVRYQAWLDWRNIAANDATVHTTAAGTTGFYFGHPTNSKVFQLYSGSTDAGTAITSQWFSKSYNENLPDVMKLYYDSTFEMGSLTGSAELAVIFDDTTVAGAVSVSQRGPQGGFGRHAYGQRPYGSFQNAVVVTSISNKPQRLKAKGQKFSVQYRVTSTGQWQLNSIAQLMMPFDHFKFPSTQKLN